MIENEVFGRVQEISEKCQQFGDVCNLVLENEEIVKDYCETQDQVQMDDEVMMQMKLGKENGMHESTTDRSDHQMF